MSNTFWLFFAFHPVGSRNRVSRRKSGCGRTREPAAARPSVLACFRGFSREKHCRPVRSGPTSRALERHPQLPRWVSRICWASGVRLGAGWRVERRISLGYRRGAATIFAVLERRQGAIAERHAAAFVVAVCSCAARRRDQENRRPSAHREFVAQHRIARKCSICVP